MAVDDRLGAELTEVLHEVVDERVVVVDHEHAHAEHATGPTRTGHRGDRLGRRRGYPPSADAAVEEQALALHAAGAEEGAAEQAVGAGHDVHVPGARRGRDRGQLPELLPGGEASNNFLLIGLVLLIAGFMLSTFFR